MPTSAAREANTYRAARRNDLRRLRKDPDLRRARGKKFPWREGWAMVQQRFRSEEDKKRSK